EQEQPVLLDREPDGPSEVVVAERRRIGFSVAIEIDEAEGVTRIERIVAEKLERRAVHPVRARFGDDVDLTAGAAAELRVVVGSQNLDLADRVDVDVVDQTEI